jgi:hypothetical protein
VLGIVTVDDNRLDPKQVDMKSNEAQMASMRATDVCAYKIG